MKIFTSVKTNFEDFAAELPLSDPETFMYKNRVSYGTEIQVQRLRIF